MAIERRRLDSELVRRGLAASRTEASVLIESGQVLVDGAPAARSASRVATGSAVRVLGDKPKYVSRGGEKLEHAITEFGIDVNGCLALDAGSSTGGFTDCLLQHGAERVIAIDVGTNQIHERVAGDPRVEVHEGTHIRDADPATLGGPVDLVVADLSFISLRTVADALLRWCKPEAEMVLLVKPQFEAGRREVSRGRGVIKDDAIRRAALDDVTAHYEALGCCVLGRIPSPITGASGNVEYLVRLGVGG
ncbi:MAG: TlyA family RNA methyltransferase [Ilumatobacteraceae bacterium]